MTSERVPADSQDGPRYEHMRVLVGRIGDRFHDVESLPAEDRARILDPDSCATSQPFAAVWREAGSNGFVYPSLRSPGGQCVAALRPKAAGIPVQTSHIQYHWDGRRVARYFDYARDAWIPVWP